MVIAIEREQSAPDVVPHVRIARDHPKLLPLLDDGCLQRELKRLGLLVPGRQLLGEHIHVEHQHQPMHRERQQLLRKIAEPPHQRLLARVEHHPQPQRKPLRPKRLVGPGPLGAPQVIVEDAFELRRGGQRHQLRPRPRGRFDR